MWIVYDGYYKYGVNMNIYINRGGIRFNLKYCIFKYI